MRKRLKIAQIAPFWFGVPPKAYGGTERVVSYITEELIKRGHKVTLFAAANSKTKANLVSPVSSDLLKTIKYYPDPNFCVINTLVNAYVFERASEFDIVHSHASYFSFYFCFFVKAPTIHTLHNQLPRTREAENELFRKYRNLNFVSISNEYRSHFNLNYIATVYHGLDLDLFPFNSKGGNYLFWIGRASKNKGELEAIQAAKKTNKKLTLALSIREDTIKYFKKFIKPHIGKNISILKDVKFENTWKYYGPARAFIFPVQWKEPFGLIMIESMACGTPVIAFARGSVPEIIKDQETGFIINPSKQEINGSWTIKKVGVDGICEAIERIFSMPEKKYRAMRRACRAHVKNNFTVRHMVDNYEKVYRQVLSG